MSGFSAVMALRATGRSMGGYESRREVDEGLGEPPRGCWGARFRRGEDNIP